MRVKKVMGRDEYGQGRVTLVRNFAGERADSVVSAGGLMKRQTLLYPVSSQVAMISKH